MPEKNIIAYVSNLPEGIIESIRAYEKSSGQKFRVMLIKNIARPESLKASLKKNGRFEPDIVLEMDFSSPETIATALQPYAKELYAVTARSESFIADFIKLIPNVPYLRTPTTESLIWASDKKLMRRRFSVYDKMITPKYFAVKGNTAAVRKKIIDRIGFPLVVKPTNLSQSLLVSVCHHEEELEKALNKMFAKITKIYKENGRMEVPQVIVEEFMDGLMFSVDAYVSSRGECTFCPLVRVKTGREIGFDDFFGYLRITPTSLSAESIYKAQTAAEKGIHALGLRSTTAHVELMRVDNDWKVIEIGARVGGYRHNLHMLTCDINHNMNDILVRANGKPVMPKRCHSYAANMHWYAKQEGIIKKISGVKKIESLESFIHITVEKKKGDKNVFAKHGGKPIFKLTLANHERSKLLADIRRVEEMVKVEIEQE